MRPITYSLQFRGQAEELEAGLRKSGRAPGCALVTSLTPKGLEARYVWSPDEVEATLESTLTYIGEEAFDEEGTIFFARGHALRIRGSGRLEASPDPLLRQGTAVWEVVDGEGEFTGACGRITSNFFLSDTGDLTESHLAVIFTHGPPAAHTSPSELGPLEGGTR